jgi:hypothetical protein
MSDSSGRCCFWPASFEDAHTFFSSISDAHADHITGTHLLKEKVEGVKSVISESSGAKADVKIGSGDRIVFGSRYVEARATPGHTEGCFSYVADDESFVLTGDPRVWAHRLSRRFGRNTL